jgi:hypothetical protein
MTDAGRGRSRRSETPWIAPESGGRAVRCQLCGAVNSGPADFCRWCGTPLGRPTDPVLGTTTRRALDERQGSPIAALLGAIAAIAVVGVTGWLLLSGALGGGERGPTPTPTVTGTSSVAPTPTFSAEPSATIGPTTEPEPSPVVSPSPGPTLSPEATPPGTATGFTCEPAAIADPNTAAWRITNLLWQPRPRFDEVQLVLELMRTDAARSARVDIQSVESAEVAALYGIERPSTSRAVVISFTRPITLPTTIDVEPALQAIREVRVDQGADDRVHAIVGVEGDGCYRLLAPAWEADALPLESAVVLQVRR